MTHFKDKKSEPIATFDRMELFSVDTAKSLLTEQLGWTMVKTAPAEKSGLKTVDPRITGACDHECTHCWAELNGAHMSVTTFRQVLDFAQSAGLDSIQFTGGEPTLNKHTIEMARLAKERGFKTLLRTHGRNLPKACPGEGKSWAEASAEIFDEIIVSIDGMAKTNFLMRPVIKNSKIIKDIVSDNDRMAAINAVADKQFQETMAGYEALSVAARHHPEKCIKINTVIAKHNLGDIPALGRYLNVQLLAGRIRIDEWDLTQVVPAVNNTPETQAGYAVSKKEFWNAVLHTATASPEIRKRAKPVITSHNLIIENDGRIYISGEEDFPIGKLGEDSVNSMAAKVKIYEEKQCLLKQRQEHYLVYEPQNWQERVVASSKSNAPGKF